MADLPERLAGTRAALDALEGQLAMVASIASRVQEVLAAGGTVYTAGNGGSAAQALHLAEELIGRYRSDRMALRAVCLNADPTALTCIANDFGYDEVFARQVTAHWSGSSNGACSIVCTVQLCGAVLTFSGSLWASSTTWARTATYSSRSAFEYDSVGSRVQGSGTTKGWWLVQ